MYKNPESLHKTALDCLNLVPKMMHDDQISELKDLSLQDLSISGSSSETPETPSCFSENNSQTRHGNQLAEQNCNSGHGILMHESWREFQRKYTLQEHLDARKKLDMATEKLTSGYKLLGQATVAVYKTLSAVAEGSPYASELNEANIRHEMACKEALTVIRSVKHHVEFCSRCQKDQMCTESYDRFHILIPCLEIAVQNLQATKERLEVALIQYELHKGNADEN